MAAADPGGGCWAGGPRTETPKEVDGFDYYPGQNLMRPTNNAAVTADPVNALNPITSGSISA